MIYRIQALGSLLHLLAILYNENLPSLIKRKTVPNLAGFVYRELLTIRYVFCSLII